MGELSNGPIPEPRGLGGRWGRGWAHLMTRPWVPISSALTQMVYLVPLLSYLVGSKSVSVRPSARPSDPDIMTNTALEAIASSRGKIAISLSFAFNVFAILLNRFIYLL